MFLVQSTIVSWIILKNYERILVNFLQSGWATAAKQEVSIDSGGNRDSFMDYG